MDYVELQIEIAGNYIKADIDRSTAFPWNITSEDLTNPTKTIAKNTTDISLPRTKINEHIFTHISKKDHVISRYNPNNRTPFRLYVCNNLYQSGYIGMEDITEDSYKVRLYDGLADYFFTMDEQKLKDLAFGELLDHKINKEFVANSFKGQPVLNEANEDISEHFGYAMTYQGQYDNFDSDSLTLDGQEPTQVLWTSEGKQYTAPNLTEHGRVGTIGGIDYFGEMRSYYQKPMLRIKTVFNKILSDMRDIHGWQTSLDNTFFNDQNPYWNDVWMLCPNYDSTENSTGFEHSQKDVEDKDTGRVFGFTYVNQSETITLDARHQTWQPGQPYNISVNIPVKFRADWVNLSDPNVIPNSQQRKRNPITIRPFLEVEGLDPVPLTFDNTTREYITFSLYNTAIKRPKKFPPAAGYPDPRLQPFYYRYRSAGETHYADEEIPDGTTFTISGEANFEAGQLVTPPSYIRLRFDFDGDTNWFRTGSSGSNDNRYYSLSAEMQPEALLTIGADDETGIRTDSIVTWEDIIGSSTSWLDLLLSYGKLFDLQFVKDPYSRTVKILTRNTYFRQRERRDWTYKIDYSRSHSTIPSPFQYRYGLFKWRELSSKYEEEYLNKFDREYGSFRVDNGNGIKTAEEDYLEGTIFNNCVIATGLSQYYLGRTDNPIRDNKTLPFLEDKSRSGVDSNFILVFKDGYETIQKPFIITDDTGNMLNYGYSWTESNAVFGYSYPRLVRTIQTGSGNYSLNFGTPQVVYNDYEPAGDSDSLGGETLYSRFWRGYLTDLYDANTRIMTAYVSLTAKDMKEDPLNKFIIVNDTVWRVNKITNYDPLSTKPTKVDLLKVHSIDAYVSQEYQQGLLMLSDGTGTVIYDSTGENGPDNNPAVIRVSAAEQIINIDLTASIDWIITDISPGITVEPTSGSETGASLIVSVPENTTGFDAFYSFRVSWADSFVIVQVLQSINLTVNITNALTQPPMQPPTYDLSRIMVTDPGGEVSYLSDYIGEEDPEMQPGETRTIQYPLTAGNYGDYTFSEIQNDTGDVWGWPIFNPNPVTYSSTEAPEEVDITLYNIGSDLLPTLPATDAEAQITLYCPPGLTFELIPQAGFIDVFPETGSGDTLITVSADHNDSGAIRTGTILIIYYNGALEAERLNILVRQSA